MIDWEEICEGFINSYPPKGQVLMYDDESDFCNVDYHIGGLEFASGYSYTHWSIINKPDEY